MSEINMIIQKKDTNEYVPMHPVAKAKDVVCVNPFTQEQSNLQDVIDYTCITPFFKASRLPSIASWRDITYGDGKFVAVGDSRKGAYSTDGISWTEIPTSNMQYLWCITYGNDRFVGVDFDNSRAGYSLDGINWLESELPEDLEWTSIAYGNGKFVTVAQNRGRSACSLDGIDWTEGYIGQTSWNDITYGDGKFVAVGHYNYIAHSTDGINWTLTEFSNNFDSITYGNGKFVAINGNRGSVACSTDAINWEFYNLPNNYYDDIIYGNGKFIAYGSSEFGAYSTDGINWTKFEFPEYEEWNAMAYGNGKFVTVAYDSNSSAYSISI